MSDVTLTEREKIIIGVSCSVVFVILVMLIVVTICYYRTKAKAKQKRHERLAATLERLSIRDPLDELVRRESRRSSFGNPAFTFNGESEGDTEKSGQRVQISRQHLSTWHYPNNSQPSKLAYSRSHLGDSMRTGVKLLY